MSGRESRARQTLQEFYEQLNQRWSDAEQLLLSLEVPASLSVLIKTAEREFVGSPRYHHALAFRRHYGRWGLCYGICAEGNPQDEYWTSIHRCSIEQRVEAARAFPELRDRMLEAARDYTETVAEALSVLNLSLAGDGDPRIVAKVERPVVPAEVMDRGAESADLLSYEEAAITGDRPDVACEEPPIPAANSASDEAAEPTEIAAGRTEQPSDALEPETVAPTPIDGQRPGMPADAEAVIVAPFSIQRWESEGGETAREAA